jgi:hypothetical protein
MDPGPLCSLRCQWSHNLGCFGRNNAECGTNLSGNIGQYGFVPFSHMLLLSLPAGDTSSLS